jgi:hypothetical protein
VQKEGDEVVFTVRSPNVKHTTSWGWGGGQCCAAPPGLPLATEKTPTLEPVLFSRVCVRFSGTV